MPEVIFCVMMALTEFQQASREQIIAASGYAWGSFDAVFPKMMEIGYIRKPWNGRWQITERGKIALAIEVGRRTKQRARMHKGRQRYSLKSFMLSE
jgi:hypothetical protein